MFNHVDCPQCRIGDSIYHRYQIEDLIFCECACCGFKTRMFAEPKNDKERKPQNMPGYGYKCFSRPMKN
jgi:Zn ribbon nucleic-acid-binding protein